MIRPLVLLLAFVLCTGCVHKAVIYKVPDSTKLDAGVQDLADKVERARRAVALASTALNSAKLSHADEQAQLKAIAPKVDYVFSLAPQELKPLISEIKLAVARLDEAQMLTTARIDTTLAAQVEASRRLDEANAAKNLLITDYGPAYKAKVKEQTVALNDAQQGWAADSAKLVKYQRERFWFWVIGSVAVLGAGILFLLQFVNRNR